ncbi:DUF4350 domain-containing protein [Paenibacillus chartarius]|uniref:DUF4350 domain-containing protein n=1 Tax=Paenibacillus chartarius TaxID=747481 RepID=A0ABV6DF44_9BACL
MRRWNRGALGLALCIAAFIGLALWMLRPQPVDQPAYLSVSADTDGTKAVTELLERRREGGVKRWERSWDELPGEANQTLLIVEPGTVSDKERGQLRQWLERGNEVLLFVRRPTEWQSFLGDKSEFVRITPEAPPLIGPRAPVALKRFGEQGQQAGEELKGVVSSDLRLPSGSGVVPMLADDKGVLAGRIAVGQGALVMVLEPDWLTNTWIAKHDHYALVRDLLLASGRGLWIDEFHHGLRAQPGFLAVYPAWFVLGCVQLSLALLLWVWQHGKRLGPVYTPRAWVRRRGDETLLAVAGWYERRRFAAEALGHQRQQLRLLLQERLGVRPEATPEEAAAAVRGRWPAEQEAKLARLLREELPAPQGKAFVTRSREMSEMTDRLEKE